MDDELEGFKRNISLPELASSYGYEIDRKASCRTCFVMKNAGSKIIVATGEDGHGIFFDVQGSASGSVIDFVMWQKGVNLGYARKTLREYRGQTCFSFPTLPGSLSKPESVTRDRAGVLVAWERMKPYKPGYLEGRGLSTDTIAQFADHIRTDERGNACFRHDDDSGLTGFEKKNKGFTGFAGGGEKALFLCQIGEARDTSEQRIIVAESAIDAMSCYQLNPSDGIYISIAGGLNPTQPELLRRTLARYPHARVFIATDNDIPTEKHPNPEGEHYYQLIRELCPPTATVIRARPPEPFKDWNDKLTGRPRKAKKSGSFVERIANAPGAGKSVPELI